MTFYVLSCMRDASRQVTDLGRYHSTPTRSISSPITAGRFFWRLFKRLKCFQCDLNFAELKTTARSLREPAGFLLLHRDVPELDNVIANLELMPSRMNSAKRDRIGSRQRDMAKKLHQAGLLSRKGFEAVVR